MARLELTSYKFVGIFGVNVYLASPALCLSTSSSYEISGFISGCV